VKVISLYNIKGGVGKTTSSVNLAYQASLQGLRVLLIDLDPQGASSYYLRIRPKNDFDAEDVLKKSLWKKGIRASDYPNLDCLPAQEGFRNLDLSLNDHKKSTRWLQSRLKDYKKSYDLILLDCPPSFSVLSESVLKASQFVIVPVVPTTLCERTYEQLIEFLKSKNIHSSRLRSFFSMVQKNKSLHRNLMKSMAQSYDGFYKTPIPYASDIEKIGITREPIAVTSNKSLSALAYAKLWEEILADLGKVSK